MSKESYERGLGRRFGLDDGTWGTTIKGRLLRRVGKTKRDKDSGAWANRLANRAARADENRGGGRRK